MSDSAAGGDAGRESSVSVFLLAFLLTPSLTFALRLHPAFGRDQGITERVYFVVDFRRVRNRASDFLAEKNRIPFAQPMHKSLYPRNADAERLGEFLVGG